MLLVDKLKKHAFWLWVVYYGVIPWVMFKGTTPMKTYVYTLLIHGIYIVLAVFWYSRGTTLGDIAAEITASTALAKGDAGLAFVIFVLVGLIPGINLLSMPIAAATAMLWELQLKHEEARGRRR